MNRALLALPLMLLPLLLSCSANGSKNPITEQQVNRDLYGNFQTAVASDRNYDVYWMGRSVDAGGLTYKGPEASARAGTEGLGAGIGLNDADHLAIDYAPDCNTCVGIAITLYSREAWDERSARTPRSDLQFEAVQVNGYSAQLWTRLYSAGGEISAWIMVVGYGRTVVEAVASPSTPATDRAGAGPVMDKATFLAVMQNLRPYPQ